MESPGNVDVVKDKGENKVSEAKCVEEMKFTNGSYGTYLAI